MGYGDLAREVDAIESGLGVLVLEPAEVMLVRGSDAAVFLHGLTTNDVKGLAIGQAKHQLLCATKGKIVHHVVVVKVREDTLAVVCEPGEAASVAGHLEHYHIREDAEMGRVELVRVDLLGPGGEAGLKALGLPLGSVEGKFGEAPVLTPLLPAGHGAKTSGLQRIMTLLPPQIAAEYVEALLKTDGAQLVGWEAYDEARIWAGIPRYGVDYAKEFFPGEATLYTHISFEKGCYVGQEIHARMHYRGHPNRKLVAVEVSAATAAQVTTGAELFHGEKAIGTLTSLAKHDHEGRRRGIALLRYDALQENLAFSLQANGEAEVTWHPLATDIGGAKG